MTHVKEKLHLGQTTERIQDQREERLIFCSYRDFEREKEGESENSRCEKFFAKRAKYFDNMRLFGSVFYSLSYFLGSVFFLKRTNK